jgi:hypothetical protein
MRRFVPALGGLVLCAALASMVGPAAPVEPAWLELLSGSARVSYGGRTRELTADAPLALRVGAALEVDSAARATLAFSGRASLSIEGPAHVSFGPVAASAAVLRLEVAGARQLVLETRAGRTLLRHPCGFEIETQRGMCRLLDRPGGQLDLENVGGTPLRLASLERRPPGSWPARLEVGEHVRLAPAQLPAVDGLSR